MDDTSLWIPQSENHDVWIKTLTCAVLDSGGIQSEILQLLKPLCEVRGQLALLNPFLLLLFSFEPFLSFFAHPIPSGFCVRVDGLYMWECGGSQLLWVHQAGHLHLAISYTVASMCVVATDWMSSKGCLNESYSTNDYKLFILIKVCSDFFCSLLLIWSLLFTFADTLSWMRKRWCRSYTAFLFLKV